MAIRFRCQSCSGLMSISSRKAGSRVPCPTCGSLTLVPDRDIFEPQDPKPEDQVEFAAAPDSLLSPDEEPKHEPQAAVGQPERDAPDADEPLEEEPDRDESDYESGDETGEDDEAPALPLHRRKVIDDEMDLTPMVDVTFQLLIFFMVTASFALQKSIEVPTPDPDKKGASQQLQILEDLEGSSIRVQIDAASTIHVDDEPVSDPARLADVLKDKMRKEQKTEVLITAHAAALHRSVIQVVDAANSVGMQKIRLVSRQGKSD